MNYFKKLTLFVLLAVGFASCSTTEQVSSIQVEILKPGIFIYPDDFDTVAVFNRNPIQSDTCFITYFPDCKVYSDTVNNHLISNTATDALSGFLKEQGYFRHVNNYRDSLMTLLNDTVNPITPKQFFQKIKSDICIFLDYINFNDIRYNYNQEFYTKAAFYWTIGFKKDSIFYTYRQIDTLYYENKDQSRNMRTINKIKSQILDASYYLGKSFGAKLIPNSVQAERMYYKSNNIDMLKAEQLALNQNWLKAAEIWKLESKNKNKYIVAKACYNLALACEMEGKYDLAFDWLTKSYSIIDNAEHKANCQRYINVLAIRKKEIERLNKQVRIPEDVRSTQSH